MYDFGTFSCIAINTGGPFLQLRSKVEACAEADAHGREEPPSLRGAHGEDLRSGEAAPHELGEVRVEPRMRVEVLCTHFRNAGGTTFC